MSAVDRTTPPEAGPIRSFDFPAVESRAFENGLDLRVARMPRLPAVAVNLVLTAGEAALPHDRAGLAALTGEALEGGTDARSGAELARALEGIGARLGASTGWDATTVSLSCLADRLDEAMALLAEVVRRPSFPEDEVERSRDQ
ncbi:MAG TPA: insulinase family protein, partial [Longimicrobiales bacterium]|nr:insulinase family protein [Longimicrobiales bacterium]